jgi:uncharacterized membrane protein
MHLKTQDKSTLAIRYPVIDSLRGIAILLMVIYHLCYDLDMFGYIDTRFGVGYWVPFRYVIVILFLGLVGVSLQIAHGTSIKWHSLKKRSMQLLVASTAVSASAYFIAAHKVTIFGILQLILVSSWLALPFLNRAKLTLVCGGIIFFVGHIWHHTLFDHIALHWIGLMENIRPALDYAPIFPWFGVVLMGISAGVLLQKHQGVANAFAKPLIRKTSGSAFVFLKRFDDALQYAGKHSLLIYLLHQPIMFGALMVISG